MSRDRSNRDAAIVGVTAALNGKPTVVTGGLSRPQEVVQAAQDYMQEYGIVGVSVSVRGDTAYFEPEGLEEAREQMLRETEEFVAPSAEGFDIPEEVGRNMDMAIAAVVHAHATGNADVFKDSVFVLGQLCDAAIEGWIKERRHEGP